MTDVRYPTAPAPVQGGPPPSAPASSIPLWVVGVAVVVMLAMVAAVFHVIVKGNPASPPRPTWPSTWDSRIEPFAKIVEQKRGLLFKHPVAVRFLPAAQFEKTVTTDEDDLDKDDRKELDQYVGLMRAMGLVSGDVDLFKATNEAHGAGTLAYYSDKDKRVTIRGEDLTVAVRATLVHELTHALQDQYFDIGARTKALEKAADKDDHNAAGEVFDALVEGDATRVEDSYRASLGPRQRRALDAAENEDQASGSDRLGKVPPVLLTIISSPYVLGETLIQTAFVKGGNRGVDKLFERTPQDEMALLKPVTFLQGRGAALDVKTPRLASGEKKIDSGDFGALTLYYVLAQRMPALDAMAAADGWGGDASVDYEKDGRACTRMSLKGRTPTDTARMTSALQRWQQAGPRGVSTVSRSGDLVSVQSCDPGSKVKGGKDGSQAALRMLSIRNSFNVQALKVGSTPKIADCFTEKAIRAYPQDRLADPKLGTTPAEHALAVRIGLACRR